MDRADLEHVIKAGADITQDEIVVVGSQAILAQYPNAPEALRRSVEADVYPRSDPERAIEIDGAIGEGSQFHELFGYYAHGVGPETPVAPAGWETRLIELELPAIRSREGMIRGWCLEAHDVVLSKLAAGREKDLAFAVEALRAGIVDAGGLERGLELMPESHRAATAGRLTVVRARV